MARMRMKKPDRFTKPNFAGVVSAWGRLFYDGLEVFGDDHGWILEEPDRLRLQIFPADSTAVPDVRPLIQELIEHGHLERWRDVKGRQWLHLVSWEEDQKPTNPSKTKFPGGEKLDVPRVQTSLNLTSPKESSIGLKRTSPVVGSGDVVGDGNGGGAESGGGADGFEAAGVGSATGRGPAPSLPPDPAPLADAAPAKTSGNGKPPLVTLPAEATKWLDVFYDPMSTTDRRRLDATSQLYDTLDPRKPGARLGGRGTAEYVRARSSEHLAECCRAMLKDPGRVQYADRAIVLLLMKLKDPAPGPSAAELQAQANREEQARQEAEERDLDKRIASWRSKHALDYDAVETRARRMMGLSPGIPVLGLQATALKAAIRSEMRKVLDAAERARPPGPTKVGDVVAGTARSR